MAGRFVICMVLVAATALSGCARHREFRVAYVGHEGAPGEASDPAGASVVRPPIVTAGNSLLGPGAQFALGGGVTGAAPSPSGTVNGTVSSVSLGSNQTLVQLTNGSSVLLNGAGAALGDVVSVDLGAGKVIGGPSSLVGVGVSSPAGGTGGQLATVSLGGGGLGGSGGGRAPMVGISAGGASPNAGSLLGSTTSTGTRAVTRATSPTVPATGSVTNVVTGPLGGGCC